MRNSQKVSFFILNKILVFAIYIITIISIFIRFIIMANIHRYKLEIIEITKKGHRTAEDVLKKMRKTYLLIGIGTVYRNLTELVNEGILMKHHGLGDKLLYEKAKPIHGHIFCQYSGMIRDIDISMIDFTGITIPSDFVMEEIQVTIAGHFTGEESAYCKIDGRLYRYKNNKRGL